VNGILIVDKPAGMTSHDAVAICRRRLDVRRIGHAGTLDPDATGVLVLGVGRATRLLQFLEGHDKTYRATFALGVSTSTQDASGEIVSSTDASAVTKRKVENALQEFRGDIEQIPPMVSAVKVGGEALYKKARRGEEIERPPRKVVVHELVLESFEPPTILVRCSKGTYIRTLVHDLGRALGVGAHVTTLRRLSSGAFTVGEAAAMDSIGPESLLPLDAAVAGFPRRDLAGPSALALVQGKTIAAFGVAGPYAVYGPAGLIAVAVDMADGTRPVCVLVDASKPEEALSS
jgi:tRNA pseudouridine55 synthase